MRVNFLFHDTSSPSTKKMGQFFVKKKKNGNESLSFFIDAICTTLCISLSTRHSRIDPSESPRLSFCGSRP